MDNYERGLEAARMLFLKWEQLPLIARCRLCADEANIYLRFLGQRFAIARDSGRVENLDMARPADFSEALSIYDYLCREAPLPQPVGRLLPATALPHAGQSSPNAVDLHRKLALQFQDHEEALRRAIEEIRLAPFPQGDVACWFPLFDDYAAVFQFWAGDEEFPPSIHFLWDESAAEILKFETLHYVMGCFLRRLRERIFEIRK